MSEPASTEPTRNTERHQRRARNYLLDPRFQLKYAGTLTGVALLISFLLSMLLYRTTEVLIRQSQQTVEQGQETVRRGQALIEESRKVSAVVSMSIVKDPAYADNPELAALFKENTAEQEKNLSAEQNRLQGAARSLSVQSSMLAAKQRTMLYLVFASLSVLVLLIGFVGIVITHKVAGPIFKMKRLLRQVGEGRFAVQSGLRKGDELQHFFDAFVAMVQGLRNRHMATIARIDAAIADLDGHVEPSRLTGLRELRRDMQALLHESES